MDINEQTRDQLANADCLEVGGSPTDSQATLCIYANELDPDFVTATTKCTPTKSRRKGARYADRPKIRPAAIGQWFLEAPEELPFTDKIAFLLASTTDDESAWMQLAKNHRLELRTAIYLRSWTEGFALPNATIAEIGKRKWIYSLSMYSAEGEEILDAFLGRTETEKANWTQSPNKAE